MYIWFYTYLRNIIIKTITSTLGSVRKFFYFLKSYTCYSAGETMGVTDFNCILSMITLIWFSTRKAVGLPTQVDKLSLSH